MIVALGRGYGGASGCGGDAEDWRLIDAARKAKQVMAFRRTTGERVGEIRAWRSVDECVGKDESMA